MSKNGKAPGERQLVAQPDCANEHWSNINICSVFLVIPGLPAHVLYVFVPHHEAGFCASKRETLPEVLSRATSPRPLSSGLVRVAEPGAELEHSLLLQYFTLVGHSVSLS